ncbi:MerC domain-containing protein [uncultured Sphingomonas sp.]|uniref:MerC domain-containing protein n=1 Tax=uncultured Sphingomonas sp. TaxID=158754 RepID=UPI00258C8994|nr:MerC domain-containing protein [uncultured Sphingomonas sp.]
MSSTSPARQPAAPHRQRLLDGFAVTASMLCLIHCLILPILLIALPVLATMLVVPEAFHTIAFAIALPTSILAMASGHARHHRFGPAMLAAAGLMLLGIGAFAIDSETAERIVTSVGAVTLAVAHVLNWRARPAPILPGTDG